jgi:predicted RNA-binding protein with PIN domain
MIDSRPSFLLVDGNNVIYGWDELLDLQRRIPGSAYPELVRRLAEYRDFTGDRIVVVFDGRGETSTEERPSPGLQVIYTGSGRTADDVIERLAIRYATQYDITVATDDRAEQDVVAAAGGHCMSVDALRRHIEATKREQQDWLKRYRRRDK